MSSLSDQIGSLNAKIGPLQNYLNQMGQFQNVTQSHDYYIQETYTELPSFADNLSRILRRLAARFGFYCQRSNHWYCFRRRVKMQREGGLGSGLPATVYWCRACRVAHMLETTIK
jgi:hypothetical protein